MKQLYRYLAALLLVGLQVYSNEASGQYTYVRSVSIVPNSAAYWEYLPSGYNPNDTVKYPLIVYVHGAGDYGNGTPTAMRLILRAGPLRYISLNQFPQSFTVNGKTYKFIIVAPQFMLLPTVSDINSVISFCIATYHVDISRIYLTGLSMGGALSWQYPGDRLEYANRLAGIVPVCGQIPPDHNRGRVIAASNLPVWATHNDGDNIAPVQWSIQQVQWINEAPPPNPLAMLTIFHATGHDAWTTTYNPAWTQNNLNIYQWMLTYSRASAPPAYQPPVVNAGNAQSISLPSSTANLTGSATGNGATITTHTWSFVSGPASPVLVSPSSYTTAVTGLTVAGTYVFRLSATDSHNLTASANTQVTVYAAPADTTTGRSINVNLYGNSDPYGNGAWNDWNVGSGNLSSAKFNYSNGALSAVTAILSAQTAVADNGANYNVTMCPQKVARYASYYSGSGGRTLTLSGLDPTRQYRIAIYATRSNPQQTTTFSTGGMNVTVATDNNTATVATLDNLTPSSGGQVVITMTHGGYYDYINGFTLTEKGGINHSAPPIANAGPDQTINLPLDSVTLDGTGSTGVNPITAYQWTILSGTGGTLRTPALAKTILANMVAGSYTVQLKVTDDSGRSALDTVRITVNTITNRPPVVTVGPNQTITTSSTPLTSTATDPEGMITSRLWTKVSAPGQKILRIGVIGSSTMYGTGPSSIDSSLVNRVRRYYKANVIIDTIYNLAVGGSTVYNGVTANFIPPGPTPNRYDPAANVTAALAKGINVLIVGYPTNGYEIGQLTIPEIMAAHQNIFDAAKAAGVPCYLGSTQPRSSFDAASQARLLVIRDSLLRRFGEYCMDFMTPMVYPGTYVVLPQYDAGDGVHLNSAAHAQLANIVIATNPFRYVVSSSSAIATPTSANTTVSSLDSGVHKFQMAAVDQYKLASSAIVTVTVRTNAPPPVPIANAGPDQVITLPASTVTLVGSGSETGGTIVSYAWTQTAGTAATIVNPASATTSITGLGTAGARSFVLTVTDGLGAKASDTVNVIVNAALVPVANAGPDQAITLPDSTVTLTGSGSETGGTIVSYAWTQTAGTAAKIVSPSSATTNITGLVTAGTRSFVLTVTDGLGGKASDTVNVTVNPEAPTQNAVINVNIYGFNNPYNNSAWNNWNLGGTSLTSAKFNYSDGTASNISAALSAHTAVADNGPNYTVTMCPQMVARYTSYYSGSGGRTLTLSGLDSRKLYRIDIFASRYNPQQTTTFSTGGTSITISTNNNTASVATFDNLTSAPDGTIVITLTHSQYYDYINGFTLTEKTVANPANALPNAAANNDVTPDELAVYPNPLHDYVELHIRNHEAGRVKVDLFSLTGSLAKEFVITKTSDVLETPLSLDDLKPGGYFLVATMGNWRRIIRLVKF